jgi:hypothetical protein
MGPADPACPSSRGRQFQSPANNRRTAWSSGSGWSSTRPGCRIPANQINQTTFNFITWERQTYPEELERVVSSLQQLLERRLGPPPYVLVYRLERLDRARQGRRLDDANKSSTEAHPRLEERRVRCDPLGPLEPSHRIVRVQRLQRERDHMSLYASPVRPNRHDKARKHYQRARSKADNPPKRPPATRPTGSAP